MRKPLLFLFLLSVSSLFAQVQYGDSAYTLRLDAGYAFNKTYSHYGNFDLGAFFPLNPCFEMQADLRLSTVNAYALGVQLRPKFALPVGEMYIETRAMYRPFVLSRVHEVTGGLSLGYRMQYVDVLFGCGVRVMTPMTTDHGFSPSIVEPWIFLYQVQAFVRPQTSSWNIAMAVSNIDNYQMERSAQPLFRLSGHYRPAPHWRVHLSAMCKPTGMFHLHAAFYGIELRGGMSYEF